VLLAVFVIDCRVLGDREEVDDLVCVLDFVFVGVPEDVCDGLTRAIDTVLVLVGD
jgi:hypothetical protein